jgi:hypothetical protein
MQSFCRARNGSFRSFAAVSQASSPPSSLRYAASPNRQRMMSISMSAAARSDLNRLASTFVSTET